MGRPHTRRALWILQKHLGLMQILFQFDTFSLKQCSRHWERKRISDSLPLCWSEWVFFGNSSMALLTSTTFINVCLTPWGALEIAPSMSSDSCYRVWPGRSLLGLVDWKEIIWLTLNIKFPSRRSRVPWQSRRSWSVSSSVASQVAPDICQCQEQQYILT